MGKIATVTFFVFLSSFYYLDLIAQRNFTNDHFSEQSEQSLVLTEQDLLQALSVPKLKMPDQYKNKEGRNLPFSINNAELPYFRPIFSQEAYANCGQSAGIGYNFTYELNRARKMPANIEANQYTPQFSWNFMNGGEGWYGVSYFHSFEILKKIGNPSVLDYGGMYNGGNKRWMSGYEAYKNSMNNRIDEVYAIDVNTSEGIETLKYWLYDHLEGDETGGVASFYAASPYNLKTLPESSPEAGKHVITTWQYPATHAMTIVGYNDSIRYDYNNDGQFSNHIDINNDGIVDVKDWEIGGFLLANSHGVAWADSGFCYVMYNSLAHKFGEGGIWNESVNVLKVKPDIQPIIGLNIKLKHNSRNKLKILAGVSSDTTLAHPVKVIDFPIFNFQGGNNELQGIDTVNNADELELALDITALLGELESGSDAKFFIQIVEKDPEHVGTGQILYVALTNFNTQQEIVLLDVPILIENNSITTVSEIAGFQFDKVMIVSEELPVVEPDSTYLFQLEAAGGLPPYKWFLLKDYSLSPIETEFPENEGQQLVFSNPDFATEMVDLPFSFPFYGDSLEKVFIHIDGFVTFEINDLPYPYFIGESTMLSDNMMIAPFMTDLFLEQADGQEVRVESEDDYFLVTWKATYAEPIGNSTFIFALKLLPTGQIITYYDQMEIPDGIIWSSGISIGDKRNYVVNNELNLLPSLSGKNIIYEPVYSGSIQPSISSDGVLTVSMNNEEIISQCQLAVADAQEIETKKQFQISTGLIVNYEINSGDDNKIDFGETASFKTIVKNISLQTIENISLNYTVDDAFVSVLHEDLSVGTLLPGEIREVDSSLTISIENNVPDQHVLLINCSLNSIEKNWHSRLSLVVNAPAFDVYDVICNGAEWIEPGLTNSVNIWVKNSGHASSNMIEAKFFCETGIIEVIGDDIVVLNELHPNDKAVLSYKLKTNPLVNPGLIVPCQMEFYKNGSLVGLSDFDIQVGQNPILLIDMDPKHTSILKLQDDLENLNLVYTSSTFIPNDLFKHKSVFVLLGTFYSNHEITYSEGLKLYEYANEGGRIYMEGRVTWSQPSTPVHDLFNVDIEGDNFFIIDTIYTSRNDTVTQQHLFFNHPDPYGNYYFTPIDDAFSVLNYTKNDSSCVVANLTDNYRTIASIIDYGSLVGTDTSYKSEDYLYFITDFFGLYESTIGIWDIEDLSKENSIIKAFPNPFSDNINIQFKLPETSTAELQVFNHFGKIVYRKKIQANMEKNHVYSIDWNGVDLNGRKVNPGIYYVKILSEKKSSLAKIILL